MVEVLYFKKINLPEIPKWRPLVLISCAISLDGKLSSSTGDSRLSSFEDKVEVHKLRSEFDAILVGINTVLRDDPHLTVSEKYFKSTKHPIRVVLDSRARTPLKAQVLTKRPNVPKIIAVTSKANIEKVEALRNAGADVVMFEKNGEVDLIKLLKYLREKYGVKKLMVEGGGRVISSFFKYGLVDLLRISINPIIFGYNGIQMVSAIDFPDVDSAPKLELYKVEKAGWSLILHYVIVDRGKIEA